ncbi:MAG: hypothetical protein L0H93_07540 [Nocardioides sp.]|nr:hypothetical protein [Nocardioides sp.]
MNAQDIHGSSTYFHECPDLARLPVEVDTETFDRLDTETDGILVLADLYVAGRAPQDLLTQRLPSAWQGKQFGQWIDIALTRRMFREIGFSFDGKPSARPRRSLTLFRAAPLRTRHGISWTTCPERAAGIGAYYDAPESVSDVWSVRIPPNRLLGFCSFEDEFLIDLEGYEDHVHPTMPKPSTDRRTMKRVDRWIRRVNPEFYAARSRWF